MAASRFLALLPILLLSACGTYHATNTTTSAPPVLPSVYVADLSDLPDEHDSVTTEENGKAASRVFFTPDSDHLDAAALDTLHNEFYMLEKNDATLKPKEFVLASRCEVGGSRNEDYILGYRRALAVKKFFMHSGVSGDLIKIRSCIKNKPFDPAEGKSAVAFNGSVDLRICLKNGQCIGNKT